MRKALLTIMLAALAACGGHDGGPKADPYAVLWVKSHLVAPVGSDSGYKLLVARVNQPGFRDFLGHIGDVNPGEQVCASYAGIPQGTANPLNDSLAIQIWFVGYDHLGAFTEDTFKSATFMPVTGPDPDNFAKWGIFLSDTGNAGIAVQESPDSFPCSSF